MENERKKERLSILKPRKPRNPLGELDLGNQEDSDDQTNNVSKISRRVSFASSSSVKPFLADPEKNTIWDLTYEESVEKSDSSQSVHVNANKENIDKSLNTTVIANDSTDMMDLTSDINAFTEHCGNVIPDERSNCVVENMEFTIPVDADFANRDMQVDDDNDMELTIPTNTIKVNTYNKLDCGVDLEVSMEQTEMIPISIIEKNQNAPVITKNTVPNLKNSNRTDDIDNIEVSMEETEMIPVLITDRSKDIVLVRENILTCIESPSTSYDDTEKLINYNLSNVKKSDFSKVISGDLDPPFTNLSPMPLRGINSTSFVESCLQELKSSKYQQNEGEKNEIRSKESLNANTLISATEKNLNDMLIFQGQLSDNIVHEEIINHEIVDMEISYVNKDMFTSSIPVVSSSQKNSGNALINEDNSSTSDKGDQSKFSNLNVSNDRQSDKHGNDKSVNLGISCIRNANNIPNIIITPSTPENANSSFNKHDVQIQHKIEAKEVPLQESNVARSESQKFEKISNSKLSNEIVEHEITDRNENANGDSQESVIKEKVQPIDLSWLDSFKKNSARIAKKEKDFAVRIANALLEVKTFYKKEVEAQNQISDVLNYVKCYERKMRGTQDHTEEVTSVEPKALSWSERISELHKKSEEYWNIVSLDDKLCKFNTLFGTIVFTVKLDNGQVLNVELEDRISEKSQTIALYIHKIFMEKLKLKPIQSALCEKFDVLSLLDYVQLTMENLLAIDKDFTYLSTTRSVSMDENFNVMFPIICVDGMFSWRFCINASDYQNINEESVTYYAKIGQLKEREIKRCMQDCPKGFPFIRAFVENLYSFVEMLEKNL